MQKLPLEGIRVIDFTTILAGPHITQWFGLMGAEVIKIETNLRLESRFLSILGARSPGPNQGETFAVHNFSKKSITLNMKHPESVSLIKELVKISDIVTENFGGSIMDRWGLGYEEIKKLKPDIIFYSGSGYGRTGPRKESPGYAPIIDALTGMISVNGYDGGEPTMIGPAGWSDFVQAQHGAFAILAALHHRMETGEGQYIDTAMNEACANLIGELFMDFSMNERVGAPTGNRDNIMAPHGCFPCKGEDKWIAIAVSGEDEWKSFCNAMGNPEWTAREAFSDELSRWKNQDELDRLVGEWTRQHSHYEVMEILQNAGVMAGASLDMEDLTNDPHLNAREFLVKMDHPVMGELSLAGFPWKLSDSPEGNYQYAPLLGEHNDYVFGELLGIPAEKIRQMEKDKVIF